MYIILSYWLRTKGPEVFSVYGLPRRTNNNIESFHGQLKEKFQTVHPNLWTFLGIRFEFILCLAV